MGTPYRVVADAGMLESGVVGLQDRDTTIQVQSCTVNREYFVSKIFHAIIVRVK